MCLLFDLLKWICFHLLNFILVTKSNLHLYLISLTWHLLCGKLIFYSYRIKCQKNDSKLATFILFLFSLSILRLPMYLVMNTVLLYYVHVPLIIGIIRNMCIWSLHSSGLGQRGDYNVIPCSLCIKAVRGRQSLEPMHKFDMAWQNTGSSGQHTAWSNLLIHFSLESNTFLTYVMHNSDFNW